jgi:hypothetical protein
MQGRNYFYVCFAQLKNKILQNVQIISKNKLMSKDKGHSLLQ